ncbi:hypothetical protein [Streptomyces smyrnaeus]|uniref:hypothetical protein n=1 Tax=Streptomyces smyrnaeus TaxID=1387713 RepID=UPI0036B081DF
MAINLTKGIVMTTFHLGKSSILRRVDVAVNDNGHTTATSYPRPEHRDALGGVRVLTFPGSSVMEVEGMVQALEEEYMTEIVRTADHPFGPEVVTLTD